MARRDLLTRLADAGEDAISRLGSTPGADRMVGVAHAMRDRVDELQRRVRGIDELERRVAELERRLDEGDGAAGRKKRAPARRAAAKKSGSGARKKTTTSKSSAASRTSRSGSKAEPTGPATQGASQAGNPEEE